MSLFDNIPDIGSIIHTGFGRRNTSGVDQETLTGRAARNDGSSSSSAASSLKGGDIISGEVVDVDGKNVKLKLSGDRYIDARLDGGVDVGKGQSMSFEVKSEGGQTALRPLYANLLSRTPQAYQALDNAGIPATESNLSMVGEMMKEGMSVGKEALYAMLKDVSAYPAASPETIVQLNKLNLPVNETNISQLENYRNLEYQIVDDAKELSDGISEMLRSDISEKVTADILSLVSSDDSDFSKALSDALSSFNEAGNAEGAQSTVNAGAPMAELSQADPKEAGDVSPEGANAGENFLEQLKSLMNGKQDGSVNADLSEAAISGRTPAEAELLQNAGDGQGTVSGPENLSSDISVPDNGQITYPDTYEGALKEMADKLKDLGFDDNIVRDLSADKLPAKDVMHLAGEIAKEIAAGNHKLNPLKGALGKLLSSDEFRSSFKDALMGKFTINPKDVSGDGNVNELYKRLLNQSEKIMSILSNSGRNDAALLNNAQNIRDNVNFMNDLNQMVQYVQLPLKMAQENAHGELYVYTKKKNLMNKDGNVSALLHLDMENLGPMDVYVAMQNNRVNTHFYMQDDDTLDFVMQNIERLDERLKAKGYDMHTSVTTKDIREDRGIVDRFLENVSEDGSVSRIVSEFAFDVRA
ncbi:MAG: flagellar hook-length control protein FliK [Lachnospiraceae bacterium]|nr:flagellar hook-length control protein FliK [Lachnospiraceae bacterium]